MRDEKLALFVERKQSVDDLLKRFDCPCPVARPEIHCLVALHDIGQEIEPTLV